MELCWTLHLCIFVFLLRNISSAPSSRYILNHNKLSFNNAAKKCPGGSVLTTIATQQEVDEILKLIFKSEPLQNGFTFWVGLRITSSECIDRSKPLRGFKWLENNSEESEVSQWAEDPEHTCTTDRCVALKGQFDGLNVTWGLIPLNCHKDKNAFICKVKDGDTTIKLGSEQPPPGDTPTKPPPPEDTPTKPPSPEDTPIKPSKPKREPGFINDSHSARSLKMLSEPTVWRLENGALANITAIKIECANATQKEEDSVLRLTILLPVLIATGVLVFLLVVIAVTVKCYLNRRSKKRAIKKAEKMEMKSKNRKDSFSLA
uniref:C-type lectin domain-containing protein n=1 Tax=Oreochromis aureus TaxID=47969 RepID=A0A668RWP2_OREAU